MKTLVIQENVKNMSIQIIIKYTQSTHLVDRYYIVIDKRIDYKAIYFFILLLYHSAA